jgi:hypothetical protein
MSHAFLGHPNEPPRRDTECLGLFSPTIGRLPRCGQILKSSEIIGPRTSIALICTCEFKAQISFPYFADLCHDDSLPRVCYVLHHALSIRSVASLAPYNLRCLFHCNHSDPHSVDREDAQKAGCRRASYRSRAFGRQARAQTWGGACYLCGVLFPILFLIAKPYKSNKFLRFHAIQAMILWAMLILLLATWFGPLRQFNLAHPPER